MSQSNQLKNHNAPTAIVVFGGTGDLAQTKLLPAFLDLFTQDLLPDTFVIIGFSRRPMSDVEYQTFVADSIKAHDATHSEELITAFCQHFRYVAGNFTNPASYEAIKLALTAYDESIKQCTNKLFYLAVPPQYLAEIFTHVHQSNAMALCDNEDSWSRLLVEKPFGSDLETAQALEQKLCSLFADEQIYRIDHYLAKDAIENIISLRFANSLLANAWNSHSIESMHIKLLENHDVSNRGSFYDAIGTLRDVGQNHVLQIFALLTMSEADITNPTAVRAARAAALKNLQGQKVDSVSRGQHDGYLDTKGVAPDSTTETYFKLSFTGRTTPWEGTEFVFESGKALATQCSEAIVTFRPHDVAACGLADSGDHHKNILRIQFAPEQKICLTMWTKKPGYQFQLQAEELVLLTDTAEDSESPEAYERVLYDCITGDQTRFVSGAEVEAAWRFITPILEQFKEVPLERYAPGATGLTDITT